jgi:hypothetical protein
MFIKLTNNADGLKGSPLYINVDHITCTFENIKEAGGGMYTFVHSRVGNEAITWEVEESPSQIMKLIEAKNAKCANCSCN